MKESGMPTTLPSPADRGEFRFVAVDASGAAWRWIDEELVWVRAPECSASGVGEDGEPVTLH